MGSKASVPYNKKRGLKNAKAVAAGAYSDNDDSMTIMDVIRTVKNPMQRNKNPVLLAVAEEEERKVRAADDLSSDSDEDVRNGYQQYKRKRKCKDLYEILKREPPANCSILDRQDDDSPQQLRRAKKSVKSSNENGHYVERHGRGKVVTEFLPDVAPYSEDTHLNFEQRAGSLVGQTDDMIETLETLISFSDSLGLCNPAPVTSDPAFDCSNNAHMSGGGKRQKARAPAALRRPPSPHVEAAHDTRSSSQLQSFQTLDSDADLLLVSGARLHTCADAKNCQNACIAKAVAPDLDHMSDEELIYWYQEVTQTKFTSRSGEKVRGRIRRVIRAEVKRASALDSTNTPSSCEAAGRNDTSALEPRTPSPAHLIVDLHSPDSRAREFCVPAVAKEEIPCAFNSAASFDEHVDEEIAGIKCNLFRSGKIPLKVPNAGKLGVAQKCEPLDRTLAQQDPPPSVVESVEVKSVLTEFASDIKYASESICKRETERDSPLFSIEKRILTEERCADIANGSESESHDEGQFLSAESSLSDSDSLGIEAYESLKEMRECGGFGLGLNASGEEESADSFKNLIERDVGAAELSQSNFGNEGGTSLIIRLECEIDEARSVSSHEEKSPKKEPGSSFFSVSSEQDLGIPDFRPSSLSREQGSPDFLYSMALQACETEASTGQEDLGNSTRTDSLQSLEATEEELDGRMMSIKGGAHLAVPVTDHNKETEGSMSENSNQSECQSMTGEILADGSVDSQRPGAVLPDLQERTNEPAEGFPMDFETSRPVDVRCTSESSQQSTPVSHDLQERSDEPTEGISMDLETSQQVHICSTSETQQCAERFDHRALGDTSGNSTDDDASIQDESQLPGVCLDEHNKSETLAEVCTTPSQEDVSQQPGSTDGVCDTSISIRHDNELANDGDVSANKSETLAEVCRTPSQEDVSQQPGSTDGVCDTSCSIRHDNELANDGDVSANKSETLAEVCTTPSQEDVSQQPGSTDGVCNTSLSIRHHNELVNDGDVSAEMCCSEEQGKGVDEEGLQIVPMPGEVPAEEIEVCDTKCVPSPQAPLAGDDMDDRVLSLEEYIAVHRAEDGASPQEVVEDVMTQELEEDVASQEVEMIGVSREGREESTEDGFGDEFGAQQTVKDVACSQNSAVEKDHLEEISDPKGIDLGEFEMQKMMDGVVSQHIPETSTRQKFYEDISALQTVEDIASQLLRGEVVSQVTAEDGIQQGAECGVATKELESDTSHGLAEEDETAQTNEKEALVSHNQDEVAIYDLGNEEAVTVKDLEEDMSFLKMTSRAIESDCQDNRVNDVAVRASEEDVGCKAMEEDLLQNNDVAETTNEADEVLTTQEEVVSQNNDAAGTTNEADELFATQEEAVSLNNDAAGTTNEGNEANELFATQEEVVLQNNDAAGTTNEADELFATQEEAVSLNHDAAGTTNEGNEANDLFATQEEVVSLNNDAAGTKNEDDEVLATRKIAGVVTSEQPPRQDSEKNLSSLHVEEEGATQLTQEGASPELKEESSSHLLGDNVMRGESDLLRASEPAAKNVAPSQEAGVGVPHSEDDIAAGQTEDVTLQSQEEEAAPDQSPELGDSSLSIPWPTEHLEEVLSYVESAAAAAPQKLEEDDAVDVHDDDFCCSQRTLGVMEEIRDDSTVSEDHGSDLTKDLCEKAGEDALDYPVILSQPRRRKIQEEKCIQDDMSAVKETPQATTSLSRRVTRASLKLEKSIRAAEEKLSQDTENVLPDCLYTGRSLIDPPVGEGSTTATLAIPQDSLPPKGCLPPLSDAELEQIDNFKYPLPQEEWLDAGKYLDEIEMSFFEEDVDVSSPRKRKFYDSDSDSNGAKRLAVEASPQDNKAPFRRVEDASPERFSQGSPTMEDDHVPTALSKAVIERNGERSGAVGSSHYSADPESPVQGQELNAMENADRVIAREKRKLSPEQSLQSINCYKPGSSSRCLAQSYDSNLNAQSSDPPLDGEPAQSGSPEPALESNCDPSTTGESNDCINLLDSEKPGEEGSSQDFETPSKLPCRRKTISPLSQLELMRASSSNSPPNNESSPPQKIPTIRLKLPAGGLPSQQGGSSLLDREPTIPGCSYLEPDTKAGKDEASNCTVVSLDPSGQDAEDICGRQEQGSGAVGGETARKFSLALSPTSSSPDSSQGGASSQEPRESQSISVPASKGILKTGPQSCKGLCKCAACSQSRSKAGTASDFISSQMKTFQTIAGCLTREMQALRTLVDTNLSSPEKTSQIQEALKKSRDVEEAADKRFATLLRDCRRYCKLTATKPIPMRRIAFADEAGKKLCHVKTFQTQSLRSVLDLL